MNLPVEMFLSLFLLNFKSKAGSKNTSWQCKKRDGKHTEARCHDLPHPRARHRIPVAYSSHRYLKQQIIIIYLLINIEKLNFTFFIQYGLSTCELRPCTEKRFSLSYPSFMLNLILLINHASGEVHK